MLGQMACFTAYSIVFVLSASSCRIAASKRFIKSLIDSDRLILMWNRPMTLCFLLIEHMYKITNFSYKTQKDVIVVGGR